MRLALVFSTALFMAVGCLPTGGGGNKNNSSGITANDQTNPSGGMDPTAPGRPDDPGMGGGTDPGNPGDPCYDIKTQIDQCFQDCAGVPTEPQPGDPNDPTGMGRPTDPNDPATGGMGGGPVGDPNGDCVQMLCQPFFERVRACFEQQPQTMTDCSVELQAQDECVRDATAQCGGQDQPPPPPDQCIQRCQALVDTLPDVCKGEPPPPQPDDVCGHLYQALDACYRLPPVQPCGCNGGDPSHGMGGGDGSVPPGDPSTGTGGGRDPNDPGRPDEPNAGTGMGVPGDPGAQCATIEAAIVELCNGPKQCGR
ncbi:MAG: hypothetical protein U1E65_08680 [Myxococcota bacterium]